MPQNLESESRGQHSSQSDSACGAILFYFFLDSFHWKDLATAEEKGFTGKNTGTLLLDYSSFLRKASFPAVRQMEDTEERIGSRQGRDRVRSPQPGQPYGSCCLHRG